MRPCLTCGEPAAASYCDAHRTDGLTVNATATARGYDSTWSRLSKRARRLQPWCSDCGAVDDLTADHSVEAWRRKADGKSIRLVDIEVVCRSCNSRRGRARPQGTGALEEVRKPRRKPRTPLHTPGGYR